MIAPNQPSLPEQWKCWGVAFNVEPCPVPPNLERLIVDTARGYQQNARLFVMTVTWLNRHHSIVHVDPLRELAAGLKGRDSARLGLLLETAQEFIGASIFRKVLARCRPWRPAEPLFDVYRKLPGMTAVIRRQASPLSRKWGLWTQGLDRLKPEALRPPNWIAQHNVAFLLRHLLRGDVRSRVVAALGEERLENVSETELTRFAGCTRRAMHLALANLESAGVILRRRRGRRYEIRMGEL